MSSGYSSYMQIFELNLNKILDSVKATAKTIANIPTSKRVYQDSDFKKCDDKLFVVDESMSDNTHISYFNKSGLTTVIGNEDLNDLLNELSVYSSLYTSYIYIYIMIVYLN